MRFIAFLLVNIIFSSLVYAQPGWNWPDNKSYTSRGVIKGKISSSKKGINGFGYDPIFIPNGYNQTFGEMEFTLKASIDHRYKAFLQIKNFFN